MRFVSLGILLAQLGINKPMVMISSLPNCLSISGLYHEILGGIQSVIFLFLLELHNYRQGSELGVCELDRRAFPSKTTSET